MDSIRKWFYRPKRDDTSLLAQFFYADEALNMVAAELDSFDGRKDPERCTALVNHLRQCQDKVLTICNRIMDDVIPFDRANRDFRVKFPDDVMQENLAGQLWFGAECLAAGSSIMNHELESAAMRPLAKALTKALENVRNMLRDQSLGMEVSDRLVEALRTFDRLFAEFELRYVSTMVPVKTPREYDLQQLVVVLFSETLQRALRMRLLSQEMVDDCDPALMFTIPRLAIVSGLLVFPDGPLCLDRTPADMSEMFRPFRTLLHKIRELLWTLNKKELFTLEQLLCSSGDPPELRSSGGGGGGDATLPLSELDDFVTRFYVDHPSCKQFVSDFYARHEEEHDDEEEDEEEEEWGGDSSEGDTVIARIQRSTSQDTTMDEGTLEGEMESSMVPEVVVNGPDVSCDTDLLLDETSDAIDIPGAGFLLANKVGHEARHSTSPCPGGTSGSLPDGDSGEALSAATESLSTLLAGRGGSPRGEDDSGLGDVSPDGSSAVRPWELETIPCSCTLSSNVDTTGIDTHMAEEDEQECTACSEDAMMKNYEHNWDSLLHNTHHHHHHHHHHQRVSTITVVPPARSLRPSEPLAGSYSSTCSSCHSFVTVSSDSCSVSSDTSSFNSECQDDEEIALAMQAAEIASRNEARAKFRSSEDLVHRLFVCIAGVADQLQTNFAGDLRNILKCVFLMSVSRSEQDEEEQQIPPREEQGEVVMSSRAVERAEEAWEVAQCEVETPPVWVPDAMAPECMGCDTPFTVVRRRHHCRNCGKVFCARCSTNSVPLPRFGHVKPVRVCNRCYIYHVTPFTAQESQTHS